MREEREGSEVKGLVYPVRKEAELDAEAKSEAAAGI